MAVNILMPALSPTMEQGTLVRWLAKEGDFIKSGDIIAEIETDKAVMELEATDEGVIASILVAEGQENVAVNTVIARLAEDGEDPATVKDSRVNNDTASQHSTAQETTITTASSVASPTESAGSRSHAMVGASPMGLQVAADQSIPEGTTFQEITVREALRDAMAEEMTRDESVFLMGEEVAEYQGAYKVSQGLLEQFGQKRVIDTPITEHGFTGIAVGAAFGGLRPVLEYMTFNFAMQAIDHIINSAAKTLYMSGGQINVPIVFRGPNGAAARVAAQHSQDYAAWYAQIPGLKVVMPYSSDDAKGLLKSAIRDDNPVVFLENEILYGQKFPLPDLDDYTVPIGRARIRRQGSDLTIVTFGIGNKHSIEAAEKLSQMGIETEIIDLRSLRPIDYDTVLQSVQKTNRCLTVEEGWPVCSIGNHIASVIMEKAFDYLDAPVLCCTGKDVPMPYAANLERHALITTDEIVETAKHITYRN